MFSIKHIESYRHLYGLTLDSYNIEEIGRKLCRKSRRVFLCFLLLSIFAFSLSLSPGFLETSPSAPIYTYLPLRGLPSALCPCVCVHLFHSRSACQIDFHVCVYEKSVAAAGYYCSRNKRWGLSRFPANTKGLSVYCWPSCGPPFPFGLNISLLINWQDDQFFRRRTTQLTVHGFQRQLYLYYWGGAVVGERSLLAILHAEMLSPLPVTYWFFEQYSLEHFNSMANKPLCTFSVSVCVCAFIYFAYYYLILTPWNHMIE